MTTRSRTTVTPAIVLRRSDYGEADRLITILTPLRGKMRVLAKGARKTTSRKAGHIELFARTQLLLAHGRTFDLITQAELIDPHLPLREDMLRGSLAHYLCELADQFAQEDHEDRALYDLLSDGLLWLSTAADPALSARYFELRVLMLSGYSPQLFRCAISGDDLEPGDGTVLFSPMDGGVVSRAARAAARGPLSISRSVLMLLRAMQTQDHAAISALEVTREVHAEAERVLQSYLSFVTERRSRAMAFVRQVQRNE